MRNKLSPVTLELIKERGFYLAEDDNYYNTAKKVRVCINHIIPTDKYYPLVMDSGSECDSVKRGIFDSYEEAVIKGIMDAVK